MRKLTKDEFIEMCINKHGNKYDYSLVEYINISNKVKIICPEHGEFMQNAKNHRDGQGCPKCYSLDKDMNKEYFIKKYGKDIYDYSLIKEPILIKSYIRIINKENGLIYDQLVDHHKRNRKPTKIESKSLVKKLREVHNNVFDYEIEKETYYATDKIKLINKLTKDETYYRVDRHLSGMKPNKVTLNYFLIKSKESHGDLYDYSMIKEIKRNNDRVSIICSDHGVFKQRVSNHMNLNDGCPKCAGVGKWNTELLVSEFKKVHSDRFDYSNVKFDGVGNKVEIICKEHGPFKQNIHKHLIGQGCSFCESISKGEEYVKMWLDEMSIDYDRQKRFKGCRYKNPLFFDFYLPELNICIEFDGIQHFKPVEWFGGVDGLNETKKRDKVKNQWCLNEGIELIRIKFNQVNRIKYILKEKLQIVDKK